MPWSIETVDIAKCGPKGDAAHLTDALGALGFGSDIDNDHKPDAIERIETLARAFNGQRALAEGAPTIKDVRERLERVEKTTKAAATALARLDDASIDWLVGRENIPGIAYSFRPAWSLGRRSAAFMTDIGLPTNSEDPLPEPNRREYMAPSIARLSALRAMAADALAEFDRYTKDAGHGGPRSIVEIIMESAKVNLVEGCYALAEEYVEPALLTTSVRPSAALARLARAVFEYATGDSADDKDNSLDRAIGKVAKQRKGNVSDDWDRLKSVLRQEHTKPV